MVLAAHTHSSQKTLFLKVLDNSLHGSFRDPYLRRDRTQDQIRLLVQEDQHMSMIAEESPAAWWRCRRGRPGHCSRPQGRRLDGGGLASRGGTRISSTTAGRIPDCHHQGPSNPDHCEIAQLCRRTARRRLFRWSILASLTRTIIHEKLFVCPDAANLSHVPQESPPGRFPNYAPIRPPGLDRRHIIDEIDFVYRTVTVPSVSVVLPFIPHSN
jgi:hypothetical protein